MPYSSTPFVSAASMLDLIAQYAGNDENFKAQQAIRLIAYTNQSVFLTGKAGAGKSHLLRRITEHTTKRFVILASTGVAALHVGGQTIHSFLRIEPRPYLPNDPGVPYLDEEKRALLHALELIIIDEVSMVRADLLQAVDLVLRKNLKSRLPFAGKQLLLIGDLFQLPPVVNNRKQKEAEIVNHNYATPYFFSAHSLVKGHPIRVVELEKNYRQQEDTAFINVLNAVRNNTATPDHLATINTRFTPGFAPPDNAALITLTTTNELADRTNDGQMAGLTAGAQTFEATLTGDFADDHSLPAPRQLRLKTEAQVMFIKNDAEGRWVNGSLGKVVGMAADRVRIRLDRDGREHTVERAAWEKVDHHWNRKTEEVEKTVTGTFRQFPLKLAWAVTIHKSQGQTFDNVIIDLGQGAFAEGQTYVALSRCRTLQGIRLLKPVEPDDIRHSLNVDQYLAAKLTPAMEREEYQVIVESLENRLRGIEAEHDQLHNRAKESTAKAAETAKLRKEVTRLKNEAGEWRAKSQKLDKDLTRLRARQTRLLWWLLAALALIGVLTYGVYTR